MPARRRVRRLYPHPAALSYPDAPCPEGQVRSWDPPHDCVAPSTARQVLGAVGAAAAILALLTLLGGGLLLAAGAARGLS